ncbi:hypothetical protein ACFVZX_01040, partial [Streptomyces erythrochromogenes]
MARVFPEGRLVYGMQLPVQSQSTIYAEPWEAWGGAGGEPGRCRAGARARGGAQSPRRARARARAR